MSAATPLLDVRELSCGFSGAPVCGPVNLMLRPGETVAIVGLNGAGKSTVLRTVVGRQHPLSGDVIFEGRPRKEGSAAWRRATAAVFDDDAWFPGLTVQEHLHLVAAGHGMDAPDKTASREIDYFGLSSRAQALPDALSSGQRRRLLLAAAFVRPAQVLFLDEPEQRLDPAMVASLADRLVDRARDEMATLVITHNPQFLTTVSDRCLVIDDSVREVAPADGAALISGVLR